MKNNPVVIVLIAFFAIIILAGCGASLEPAEGCEWEVETKQVLVNGKPQTKTFTELDCD